MKSETRFFRLDFRRSAVLTGAWIAALFIVFSPVPSSAQMDVEVGSVVALGSDGLSKSEFLPGEGVRYRATVISASGPYSLRLVITGTGWYETHEAGPFTGGRTVEWGGVADPLYTSGDACSGKVSLFLEVQPAQDQQVSVQGRPHGYFTVQCPQGFPDSLSERIDVGLNPWDMAMSQDNRYLYVTSQDDHIITVIDADLWETVAVLPDWGEVDRQIEACQAACPPGDLECLNTCVSTYRTVGRPSGVTSIPGSPNMLVADYQLERIHIIERTGSQHRLAGYIQIPRTPPGNLPMNLSDVVISPNHEIFTTDFRDARVFRLNLDPPHNIEPLDINYVPGEGNSPLQILLDPTAPNQNFYVLCAQVIKANRLGALQQLMPMNMGVLAVAMALNPDPARAELYVVMSPAGEITLSRLATSAFIYYWNLNNPTAAGGSGPVFYNLAGLWDLAPVTEGEYRGRLAYVIDSYQGEVSLVNLESRILMRCCDAAASIGGARLLEDPERNRVYVGNWPGGFVEYVYGE